MTAPHRPPRSDRLPDLRLLEPLDPDRDRSGSPAAQQLLTEILGTSRAGPELRGQAVPGRQGLSALSALSPRPGALVAAALAVTVGVVAVPALQGGTPAAFASWTPVPTAVPPAEASHLAEDCLSGGRALGDDGPVTVALTERRGEFTSTLVATDDAIGNCIVLDPTAPGGDSSTERAGYAWGSLSDLPLPAPDGTTVQWGSTLTSAAGEFTSAIGRAGAQVVAVEISSDSRADVQALVDQGFFTAWWPGGPDDTITVTTTLSDGTRTARQLRTGDL